MFQKLKDFYHLFQSLFANIYYGFPSRKLKAIGVTGTDGKTTTTHLIYHILKSSGKKVSMVSSVYAHIAGRTYDTGFHVTTPDVFPLQHLLAESVEARDEYFVLETTSHALSKNRVSFVDFQIGAITNITHEHLDFHKTYDNYVSAKVKLLQQADIVIANKDDASYPLLSRHLKQKILSYGMKQKADFNIDLAHKLDENLAEFNRYNYLAAYAVCLTIGIPADAILKALRTFVLPIGRYEIVVTEPVIAIIDFAHTPNGIKAILSDVKKRFKTDKNRIIHVFGSAAKRDESKRPIMGEESGNYADTVILTEEDCRDENPEKIAREIARGLVKKGFTESDLINKTEKSFCTLTNRKEAIDKALQIANPGDIIVLTGKGHEKSICRGKIEYPWNEKKVLLESLKKKT